MGDFQGKVRAGVDELTRGPEPDSKLVGKRSGVDMQAITSSDYANHGAACDTQPQGAGCSLSPAVRGRVVAGYQQRVMVAGESYRHACAALRVERLVEKDDDLPWVVTFLIDAASAYTGGLVGTSLKALRTAGLQRVANELGTSASGWGPLLGAVSDKAVEQTVKQVFDVTKKAGSARLRAVAIAPPRAERAASIDYLTRLMDQSAAAFTRVREQVPASASDSELLVLFEAFHPDRHAVGAYLEALRGKVARYHTSGVEQLGRRPMTAADQHLHKADPRRTDPDDRDSWRMDHPTPGLGDHRAQRVVRVVFASGHPGYYAYTHHDYDHGRAEPTSREPYYAGMIDPEFADVAVERHRQVWGEEPDRFLIDESELPSAYEPDRVRRAHATRRRLQATLPAQTRAQLGLPRIDLGPPAPAAPAAPIDVPDAFRDVDTTKLGGA